MRSRNKPEPSQGYSPGTREFTRSMHRRLILVFLAVLVMFLALVARIAWINAESGGEYERTVLAQQNYDSRIIPYRRGNITDRNGTLLATSERVYNVVLDAVTLHNAEYADCVEPTLTALSETFGLDVDEVMEKFSENPESRYLVLKKTVDFETAQTWNALAKAQDDIAGVWLEEDFLRSYPYGSLACDVIGFTSAGNVGTWGVEQAYNEELNGTNGRSYGYLTDKTGLERTVREAQDGHSLTTTIDVNIQETLETAISTFVREHDHLVDERDGCENIGAIAMNPNTGEVLGMASYPNYDLNHPRDLSAYYDENELAAMSDEDKVAALQRIWRNYCVSDTYEPGSTAKVCTVATGLETGVLKGEETYYCEGAKEVSEHIINCHDRAGHGLITLEESIMYSCNVALMDIALEIGPEDFYRYQGIFGFGRNTGIDLPGEADTSNLVFNADDIVQSDLATNAFGQNFNCTMIQMASAYCSIINGGHYYRPYVVKAVTDSDGDMLKSVTPVLIKETVTRETSDLLKQYMKRTVEDGTAKAAQVEGYEIGGKTGTAERLPRGNDEYVISFAGFAPVENPQVMLYLVIDRPNAASQEDISLVTGMASEVFEVILPYLNIDRKEAAPEEDLMITTETAEGE